MPSLNPAEKPKQTGKQLLSLTYQFRSPMLHEDWNGQSAGDSMTTDENKNGVKAAFLDA